MSVNEMGLFHLPKGDVRYLADLLLDPNGLLRVLPFAALKDVPQEHLSQFCLEQGLYCLPTLELIDFLRAEIAGEPALEIGAGNGAIGRALGICSTDSKMQERPEIRAYYDALGQPTVTYGPDVLRYDALEAVRKFKPHTVVAAWVTHKYLAWEHERGGNIHGVDEGKVLGKAKKYVFIGNESVHKKKPIRHRPHRMFQADWLLSRSLRRSENVIWIWEA